MSLASRSIATVAAVTAGAAVLYAWRRKALGQRSLPEEAVKTIAELDAPEKEGPSGVRRYGVRRRRAWQIFIISLILSVMAAATAHFGYSVLAAVCLLGGMVLCAAILRGPYRRNSSILTGVSIALFAIQFAAAGVTTTRYILYSFADVPSLLELTIFSICAFGIAVCLGATWLPEWSYTEPLGIGLVAVALGALCFPGLRLLTQQLTPPYFTGSALLFATGKANQELKLYVDVTGLRIGSNAQGELFQIGNSSTHKIRWALLVTDGAQLSTYTTSKHVNSLRISASGIAINNTQSTVTGQLFSGSLGADTVAIINGISEESFADYTSDQTAVGLPDYGEGVLPDLSSATQNFVNRALGAAPIFRDSNDFSAQISAGPVFPLDSVTASSLAPTQDPNLPDTLEWTIHGISSISYAITNQEAANGINNFLFAFAILLGVAGAAVMASLQGAIHASSLGSRPSSIGRNQH